MENLTEVKCNCGQTVIQIFRNEMFTKRPVVDLHNVTEVFQNQNTYPITVMKPHRCDLWSGPVYLTNNYIIR